MKRALVSTALAGVCGMGLACAPPPTAQDFVASGDRYAKAKQYSEALVEYQRAVAADLKSSDAHARLADMYLRMGDLHRVLRERVVVADLRPHDADAQLKAGESLLSAGLYDAARVRARNVLTRDRRNVAAHLLEGNASAGLKDPHTAILNVGAALRVDPNSAQAYVTLGSIEFGRRNYEEAQAAFLRAVEVQPTSVPALVSLANFYWATNRFPAAEDPLTRAVALEPENIAAQRELAAFFILAGRGSEAEAPLRTVAFSSKDVGSRLMLADYYMMAGRHDEAEHLLSAIASDKAGFASATTRLAAYSRARGRLKEGDAQVDAVLTREPLNVDALILKARFLVADGHVDAARERARTAVQADRWSTSAQYVLGTIEVRRGDVNAAIVAFTEVTKLNPKVVAAAVALARLHMEQGRLPTALQFAEQARRLSPDDVSARLVLARVLTLRGEIDRATTVLQSVATDAGSNPARHVQLGLHNRLAHDPAGARREFGRAMELDPTSLAALRGLVSVDVAENQFAHARQLVESRIASQPGNPGLLLLAADLSGSAGDVARQEALLRQTIEADAGNVDAFERLAGLYLQQGRLDQARTEYQQIANERPESDAAPTMVALILEAQNKPTEAQKAYEKVLEVTPNAALAANNLAWLYAEHGGNLDVALQLAQTAKKNSQFTQVDDTLGWIYYKKDLPKLAILSFLSSVRAEPTNPTYHTHLGLAYMKAGETAKGLAAFDTALKLKPDPDEGTTASSLTHPFPDQTSATSRVLMR